MKKGRNCRTQELQVPQPTLTFKSGGHPVFTLGPAQFTDNIGANNRVGEVSNEGMGGCELQREGGWC